MDIQRIVRHLVTTSRASHRAFPKSAIAAIEQAIGASEGSHSGEIRFVIEAALDGAPLWRGLSPRDRALDLFSQLRVWDTEHNCGVLIYVLLADCAVEIVADRGIHRCCGAEVWSQICQAMETRFAAGEFESGAKEGIAAITNALIQHFPRESVIRLNELPDRPALI